MNTKHTPGPWTQRNNLVFDEDGNIVAMAANHVRDYDVWCANAKLVAAAPELLETLEKILPYLKASGTNGNHWAPEVENAIKKATE